MRIVSQNHSQTLSNTQPPNNQIHWQSNTNIQGYNITLTTSHVQEANKISNYNNSHGPDKLIIRNLKHIGPLGLAFLMSMFKTALNNNIIPHTWKLANIVPIPKPQKHRQGHVICMTISLFSVIAKTLEKSLLPYITANPDSPGKHGSREWVDNNNNMVLILTTQYSSWRLCITMYISQTSF